MSDTTNATTAGPTLAVDWTRCDGHGLCAALLPDAIGLDEWGYPILDRRAISAAPTSSLRRVATACPALAIRMEKS
jgi:ferredoxin